MTDLAKMLAMAAWVFGVVMIALAVDHALGVPVAVEQPMISRGPQYVPSYVHTISRQERRKVYEWRATPVRTRHVPWNGSTEYGGIQGDQKTMTDQGGGL